jgi:DDE_Tnp_1-associated
VVQPLGGTMLNSTIEVFLDHFGELEDNRETENVLHPVGEILLVTLCGVIAGAEGWEDIEDYGSPSCRCCGNCCHRPCARAAAHSVRHPPSLVHRKYPTLDAQYELRRRCLPHPQAGCPLGHRHHPPRGPQPPPSRQTKTRIH